MEYPNKVVFDRLRLAAEHLRAAEDMAYRNDWPEGERNVLAGMYLRVAAAAEDVRLGQSLVHKG